MEGPPFDRYGCPDFSELSPHCPSSNCLACPVPWDSIGLASHVSQEIENSNRFMEPNPDDNPLMVDLLWSDPKGKEPSPALATSAIGGQPFAPILERATP